MQLVPVQTIRIAQYIKEVVATRQRPRPEVGQNPSLLCINLFLCQRGAVVMKLDIEDREAEVR